MSIEEHMRAYGGGYGSTYGNATRFCRDLKSSQGPYLDEDGSPLVLADGTWAIVKTGGPMQLDENLWVDSWEHETIPGSDDSRLIAHMSNGESWVFQFAHGDDSYGDEAPPELVSFFSGKPKTVTTTIWEKA